jgi:uncharacterized protein YkwD
LTGRQFRIRPRRAGKEHSGRPRGRGSWIGRGAWVTLPAALCVLAVSIVGAASAARTRSARVVIAQSESTAVLVAVNRVRVGHGLRPLRASALLTTAATQHSRDMAIRGYFDHVSPSGPTFAARLRHYYPSRPGRRWGVAENILWSSGTPTAQQELAAYMKSPEHRANILNPAWHEIGVGIVHALNETGAYGGRKVTFETVDFGVR